MKKKIVALALTSVLALSLAACGSSASGEAPAAEEAVEEAAEEAEDTAEEAEAEVEEVEAAVEEAEAADEPDAGFQENPIWEDEEVGFLNVSGVYFQPVPMSGGNENYEDYDLHFEADVSVLEDVDNGLGFGPGDWVPYMTVTYTITGSDGNVAAEGTFMPMSASDGPHYGANIKLPNADTYSVHLNFDMDENSYLIHLDDVTGPGSTIADQFPFELDLPEVWDYVPQEW